MQALHILQPGTGGRYRACGGEMMRKQHQNQYTLFYPYAFLTGQPGTAAFAGAAGHV